MDKETYDAFRILLIGYFLDGGSLENALETVRASWLDAEAQVKAKEA